MGTRIYTGPRIRFDSYADQTWWFHHTNWQPSDWIRASAIISRHAAYGPDVIYDNPTDYKSRIEVVRQWTETVTHIHVPPGGGSGRAQRPSVVHHVTFRLLRSSRGWFFVPRFLVVN